MDYSLDFSSLQARQEIIERLHRAEERRATRTGSRSASRLSRRARRPGRDALDL